MGCTPGKLTHLVDLIESLNYTGIQNLVLDEADHILDTLFLPALITALKRLRYRKQTLLFSAIRIKKSSFKRLSVYNPHCFFLNTKSISKTPLQLQHMYIV